MAIDYNLFYFSSAPRTGSTWGIKAFHAVGLGAGFKAHVHKVHTKREFEICLSFVRHPCDWLASYYAALHGGMTGVQEVDVLNFPAIDFDEFIRNYLKNCPGAVGRAFKAYNASCHIKIEDTPWAVVTFLESMGVPKKMRNNCLGLNPQNISKHLPRWSPHLYAQVQESEKELVDEYNY